MQYICYDITDEILAVRKLKKDGNGVRGCCDTCTNVRDNFE